MKTIREYLLETLDHETLVDITKYGCGGGIGGFIYYTETTAFHDEFEDQIWELLYEDSEDQGITIIELIAALNGQKDVGSMAQFKNLLCWYAVERVAYEMINGGDK